MRWYHWVLIACVVVYLADLAVGRFIDWRRRRDEFVRNSDLNRFNMAAFRGTRKFDDPRWPT